ncbi:MAG TPA: hypothetical protein VF486_12535 [Actinomycetes bacterium]|jgi:hypothetical protein
MSRNRLPLASTLAWLRTWTGSTQFSHPGAASVARHTGARC